MIDADDVVVDVLFLSADKRDVLVRLEINGAAA